jgi:hypothetical protein
MRFSTKQHPFSCGIDLHARTMDGCLLSQDGAVILHRTMQASPDAVLQAMAPSRDALVIAVEGLLPWDWLADLGAQAGRPCVLGHALSMKALHGGTTKHDPIDSQKIAGLLRGGLRPQADGSPAALRATRDLLRRRTPLMRQRAAWLAPLQHPTSQDTLPEMGKPLASTATRDGGAERCPAPAVPQRIAGARARLGPYDQRLRAVARSIRKTAKPQKAQPLDLRRTGPGSGARLRCVRRYDIHEITRFPRGQDCLA